MPKNVGDHYLWLFGFESSEGIPNVASDRVIRDVWNNLGGFIFSFLEKKLSCLRRRLANWRSTVRIPA